MRIRKGALLVSPRLQMRVILWFLCLSVLSLFFQFLLMQNVLRGIAWPSDAEGSLAAMLMDESLWVFLDSMLLAVPLTLAVGLLATFHIAGPAYRVKRFLSEAVAGKQPGRLQLRRGDELTEIADLASELVRSRAATAGERDAA